MTSDEMLDQRENVLNEFDDRVDPSHGVMTLGELRWFTAQLLADEIIRLRQALREANRPPEDAEHHPYHWGEMADMAIEVAVRIAQSHTSRCLSCGAWV